MRISIFLLEGGGTILEELSLALVEESWLNLKFIAKVSDNDLVDQLATKDSNFFISRVVMWVFRMGRSPVDL